MTRLIKIGGSRFAGIFCLLFAFANRVVFSSLYSLIGVDTKLQLVHAQNLLAGKGMGVTKYFTNDLNSPIFDTQQLFPPGFSFIIRSEEHTSELQSQSNLVCRLLLEKKKNMCPPPPRVAGFRIRQPLRTLIVVPSVSLPVPGASSTHLWLPGSR